MIYKVELAVKMVKNLFPGSQSRTGRSLFNNDGSSKHTCKKFSVSGTEAYIQEGGNSSTNHKWTVKTRNTQKHKAGIASKR